MPCPHAGLQVGGRCYFCLKQAALNGHRAKLSVEQLMFVGFLADTAQLDQQGNHGSLDGWSQPNSNDKQLEELSRLRDVMPGWVALAKRILEDKS